MSNSQKIFIACPYNGTDDEKETRVETLSKYCVYMFERGNSPISPLLMGLMISKHGSLPTDTETWKVYSETLLKGCDQMHVLMLDGWDKSTGIKYEILEAQKIGITIVYVEMPNPLLSKDIYVNTVNI